LQVLQDKLRYAIAHCKAIDTDFAARGTPGDDSEGEEDAQASAATHAADVGLEAGEELLSVSVGDYPYEFEVGGPQGADGPCRIS
jgi:hypothetical protein